MEKILVVDDEVPIVTLLQFNLEAAGYVVVTALDGQYGYELVKKERPDLIILDLMLPGMDGMEFCKRLRQENDHTPILMLTARDDELDKVLGLELGADDYLTKPFSPRELVARVKAILRRARQPARESAEVAERLAVGELVLYPEKREVYKGTEPVELTPKEFDLLCYLMRHRGRVMTRDQLLHAVWNYEYVGDSRIVDVHISHLREKIEDDTKRPVYIKTVRGIGYKLEGPKDR
ncbi:MAG: response regulator transcription factor [Bacillota bacterium]